MEMGTSPRPAIPRPRALVTGATGGLGKAFAAELASRGHALLLTDRSEPALASLADGLRRLHGADVAVYAADLADPAARDRLFDALAARGDVLTHLVNVAGLDFEGPFADRTAEELCTIVRVNIEATVAMIRRALAFRDPLATLRVVTVASLAGWQPMPVKAVYAASKRFLIDLTVALGREMRGQGVTFTAVCPAGMPSNPEVMRAIDRQGLIGQLTTMNVGPVAKRTLDRAERGASVFVPGALNAVVGMLSRLVPPAWTAALVGWRWSRARARSPETARPATDGRPVASAAPVARPAPPARPAFGPAPALRAAGDSL